MPPQNATHRPRPFSRRPPILVQLIRHRPRRRRNRSVLDLIHSEGHRLWAAPGNNNTTLVQQHHPAPLVKGQHPGSSPFRVLEVHASGTVILVAPLPPCNPMQTPGGGWRTRRGHGCIRSPPGAPRDQSGPSLCTCVVAVSLTHPSPRAAIMRGCFGTCALLDQVGPAHAGHLLIAGAQRGLPGHAPLNRRGSQGGASADVGV